MSPKVTFDRDKVAEFCRRNHIRKLSLFGSVLRDDFRPDSDVDVLVEFEPGRKCGTLPIFLSDVKVRLCARGRIPARQKSAGLVSGVSFMSAEAREGEDWVCRKLPF